MKITVVALLGLVSVAAAWGTKKTPKNGEAGWDYCGEYTTCGSEADCQMDPDCRARTLYGDPDYIGCGVDIFQPHTCWAWVKGEPH
ncbi:hypothetical protein GX50_05164 [[Emmonsia] crescens]|uniref:Uncharacterized protein n=1 Tax=[Emmonsia] crescens TaxID=73230 RepID=A0A2B7ZFS0_9EURO|nr:hypothetical protein GX50_05164 [Emmonsia crescens]